MQAGDYIIARCSAAGVHAGEFVSREGQVVTLKNSRRLWYWVSARNNPNGTGTLSEVATHGLSSTDSRVRTGSPVAETVLLDACELIACTRTARESIEAAS